MQSLVVPLCVFSALGHLQNTGFAKRRKGCGFGHGRTRRDAFRGGFELLQQLSFFKFDHLVFGLPRRTFHLSPRGGLPSMPEPPHFVLYLSHFGGPRSGGARKRSNGILFPSCNLGGLWATPRTQRRCRSRRRWLSVFSRVKGGPALNPVRALIGRIPSHVYEPYVAFCDATR